jgi:hypothetical protein
MSEYQYYEFQAVDRPLSKAEMAELRALTSRATITPSLLRNVYQRAEAEQQANAAAAFRARHTRKPSFVARIDEAGLGL